MKITIDNIQDVFKAKPATIETMELKGFELVEEFFVDSSGFGLESEPALTPATFEDRLTRLIEREGPLEAVLTGIGQFQVYVGLFRKSGKSKAKKIANNTYLIDNGDSRAIRLHDTDILTEHKGWITLNNGGWQSKTTKERMNTYLPDGVYITQKNYEWFVNDKPYKNGMKVRGKLQA